MNQFDLNLFETMEAHITKDNFKALFGPHRRPSKEDFLWLCDVNRMYQVDHAQQFRGFNNAAIYYKLILKKYNQKSNVQAGTPQIQDKIKKLTDNSTINELFGVENKLDKLAVANKDQLEPLSRDPIRLAYTATIEKQLIENSTTIISKSYYDMSSVSAQAPGVSYRNVGPTMSVSDNIGYTIWFNLNNYIMGETYSFFNYYDSDNSLGWKSNLINDTINVNLNSATYSFDLTGATIPNTIGLDENTWYCYVLNIDQRQRTMDQFIYKRNIDDEDDAASLNSTVLKLVYENTQVITPVGFELENTNAELLGSDMNLTNVRLFNDIIPKSTHNKILNQYIVGVDSKFMLFADNATARIYLPLLPYGNENPGNEYGSTHDGL
jgi:hypothetical protein